MRRLKQAAHLATATLAMSTLFEILKWAGLLLLSALIDVPFLRLGSRLLGIRRYSFGATYLLALIVSGCLIVAGIVFSPLLSGLSENLQLFASAALSIAVSGWVIGYFITTENRQSIGFARGLQLTLVVNLLFAAAALVLAAVLARVLGSLDIQL